MSTIDRYLFRVISRSSLLILLVLLALSGFINLVDQLDDVGTGRFQTADAIFMVLFQWPRHAFDMFPMAVLLGTLLGMGALANHSELVVIRAAGVSIARLAVATLMAGIALAIAAGAVGEFVVPPAERFAEAYKAELKEDRSSLSRLAGTWFRDGPRIVNILQVQDETRLGGIFTYEFNPNGKLLIIGRAPTAVLTGDARLDLQDYVTTRLEGDIATVEEVGSRLIDTELGADLLESSVVPPESMSSGSLLEYARYLRANDLQSVPYELAFWSRLANVVAVAAMAVLALPFVFGTQRSGGQGVRLLVGMLIGVVFFLAGGAMADSATVYGIPPMAAAWIPVALIVSATGVGLARAR
jgi:lipopolysaccharide export system permease protein